MVRETIITKILGLSFIIILVSTLSACGGGSQGLSGSSGSSSSQDQTTSGGGTSSTLPLGNLSVSLSWTSPLTYEDSSPLNDLAGTNIYVKVGSGNYELLTSIKSASTVSYVIHNLGAGYTYTFAVAAFNSMGVESKFSSPFSITL